MEEVFRKEIKYPISVLDFCRLQKRLQWVAQLDPHSGKDGYHVRSLYFDTNDDQDLFDTLGGNTEKRKIRLRFYPPDTSYIRLEYKCKSGTDGIKRTIRLSIEEAQRLAGGDYSPLLNLGEPFALELYGRLVTRGYRPKVVIDYHRLAYTYPVSNTRLNFDSAVSASFVTDSFFDEDPGLVPIIAPDWGIFEVKYDHFLVGIFKEILESADSLAKTNSKYVQSRFLF